LTARRGDAVTGMLASWVQQCSFEPPRISVVLGRERSVAEWLHKDVAFVLNILAESQTDLIRHFGKGFAHDEPAFNGLATSHLPGGGVVLDQALAFLECRVSHRWPVDDQILIIGEVVSGKMLGLGQPMVHVRKNGLHY
jgi:flavin reductase (DIM6/NTAB) family NADH-FMN oxidoreductase RutF